jgi:hypothetical protein
MPRVDMGTSQDRLPAVSALPIAYVVSGDTGLRQTSEVNWANKFLNAEEIAVEIPIARKVVDDMSIDTWGIDRAARRRGDRAQVRQPLLLRRLGLPELVGREHRRRRRVGHRCSTRRRSGRTTRPPAASRRTSAT